MSWQLAVIGVVAVLGVLGIIVYFAKDAKDEGKDAAVGQHDSEQQRASLEAIDKAEEVGRHAPKTARSLREWLRGGRV